MTLVSFLLPLVFLVQQNKGYPFEEPILLRSGGEIIDVEMGHAAPLLVDLDGDGKRELLVGQFGEGRLRIYDRTREAKAYGFGPVRYFEVGKHLGRVPTG